jgi:hypothetical protein
MSTNDQCPKCENDAITFCSLCGEPSECPECGWLGTWPPNGCVCTEEELAEWNGPDHDVADALRKLARHLEAEVREATS